MRSEILYGPAFATARLTLSGGETVRAEAGAMVAMSTGLAMQTSTQGGVMKGLRRAVLGGESFFMNTFTAPAGGAELYVAPPLPGDVVAWPVRGTLFVQSGSFLASSADVEVDTSWGGARTFFSREGLFILRVSGQGDVVLSSYGAILTRTLGPGEAHTIDTGHVVAFDESIQYNVMKAGNWKTTVLGGEGLVTRFVGPGRLWLQTRNPSDFLAWLIPKLPTQRS